MTSAPDRDGIPSDAELAYIEAAGSPMRERCYPVSDAVWKRYQERMKIYAPDSPEMEQDAPHLIPYVHILMVIGPAVPPEERSGISQAMEDFGGPEEALMRGIWNGDISQEDTDRYKQKFISVLVANDFEENVAQQIIDDFTKSCIKAAAEIKLARYFELAHELGKNDYFPVPQETYQRYHDFIRNHTRDAQEQIHFHLEVVPTLSLGEMITATIGAAAASSSEQRLMLTEQEGKFYALIENFGKAIWNKNVEETKTSKTELIEALTNMTTGRHAACEAVSKTETHFKIAANIMHNAHADFSKTPNAGNAASR